MSKIFLENIDNSQYLGAWVSLVIAISCQLYILPHDIPLCVCWDHPLILRHFSLMGCISGTSELTNQLAISLVLMVYVWGMQPN